MHDPAHLSLLTLRVCVDYTCIHTYINRNPWSDLTPVGPYISPPGAFLRDRITPGSSGKRRRHPAYAGGGGNLTFGSSAEKKMHEYLEVGN